MPEPFSAGRIVARHRHITQTNQGVAVAAVIGLRRAVGLFSPVDIVLRQRFITLLNRQPVTTGLQQRLPFANQRALLTRLNRALQPANAHLTMARAGLNLPHCAHQFGIPGIALQRPFKGAHGAVSVTGIDPRQRLHPVTIGGIGQLALLLR